MVLVLLLTLIPAQAAEENDTGTDEGKKTYTVTLKGNGGSLSGASCRRAETMRFLVRMTAKLRTLTAASETFTVCGIDR